MIKTHVVRAGEHLATIAHDAGLDPEVVWGHPKNKELRDRRQDENILCEGDILSLPLEDDEPLPLVVGGENRFSAIVPEIETHLCFADARGPFAGEAYVVEGLDAAIKGTTDGDGKLTITAPVTAKIAKIRFEKRGLTFSALLGEMDPITEPSGVQLRLALLGYLVGPASGELDDVTVEALKAFQKAKGLTQNGAMDPPTLDRLKEAYGC
jgi:hypothetical protein